LKGSILTQKFLLNFIPNYLADSYNLGKEKFRYLHFNPILLKRKPQKKDMKTYIPLLIAAMLLCLTAKSQKVIFLHHSTGGNVFYEGNVEQLLSDYNKANGVNYSIRERAYPNDPYPWENYPYDFWNLWVNNACNSEQSGIECLSSLASKYDVIIFKHCFPGAGISEDLGTPDVSSDRKSLENYKEQYRALRQVMDSYPATKFMVWTLAPLHRNATYKEEAARAKEFVNWVKDTWLTEDGKLHPNIYIFDFYGIVAESEANPANGKVNCLKYEYEGDHDGSDSHPNNKANQVAGPLFVQAITNCIEDKKLVLANSITITSVNGLDFIDIAGGTLPLQAEVSPENTSVKTVEWSVISGDEYATISSEGEVTALKNGNVTVQASSVDGSGVKASFNITITNQEVLVETIAIHSEDGNTTITEKGGALQLYATVTPENATNPSITWSIESGNEYGQLSENGLLTAVADGTIVVKATTNDLSTIYSTFTIEIKDQTVSADEYPLSDLRIIYNSNSNDYTIYSKDDGIIKKAILYNVNGEKVIEQSFTSIVSLPLYSKGIFLLKIIKGDRVTNYKLMY